jgi:iron complex transport system ATP-binding protein
MSPFVVHLENVSLKRKGHTILSDVSFSVRRGETWALLGPNGAGKSFLLRVLSGDLVPSSGSVHILDRTIGSTDMRVLRRAIGYVSSRMEHCFPSDISTLEVILSGFYGSYGIPVVMDKDNIKRRSVMLDQEQRAEALMQTYGLYPKKALEFSTLSDGEKKRTLIARALVHDPLLLVFDEPCQGLDIAGRRSLLALLSDISKRVPSVFVVHHLEELPSTVTHVACMKFGKIVRRGRGEDVLTAPNLSELFDTPLSLISYGRHQIIVGDE